METRVLEVAAGDAAPVAEAAECLRQGKVVALPTETVYGLAGDALNPTAVARIFEAKDRPRFDPLIVHVADWAMAQTVADCADPLVAQLAAKFWPGPLTLLLPKRAIVSDLVTAGSPLVAVRVPAHPVFQAVLKSFGGPLAAPSANPFGRISPTEARHVVAGLGGRIPLVLDGGPCRHGLESTIVQVVDGRLELLREGPVSREELRAFAPVGHGGERAAAPGQLASHYAPRRALVLVVSADDVPTRAGCGFLAFRSVPAGFTAVETLSPTGDLVEAAARLFAAMHRLDDAPVTRIYAEKIPCEGLGRAIMDRLTRAAAEAVG